MNNRLNFYKIQYENLLFLILKLITWKKHNTLAVNNDPGLAMD